MFLALDPDLVDRLRQLGAATGTSMFMVVQGAVAVLLARLGGGPDIPLGTPVTVRNDARLDELVGFFLNTVVLRWANCTSAAMPWPAAISAAVG